MSGILSVYLAIFSPSDDGARRWFLFGAILVTLVWLSGAITFAILNHFRDQERERRDERRDVEQREAFRALNDRIGLGSGAKATEGINSTSLRRLGQQLAKEIRALRARLEAAHATSDEIAMAFFDGGENSFWSRLDTLKNRMENILKGQSPEVTSSVEWMPTSLERLTLISDSLERESLRIPEEVEL